MLFGSIEFWLLLPVAVVLFYFIPAKYRWSILLAGSIAYLGYLSVPFLTYAIIYATANYIFGLVLEKRTNPESRKRFYYLFLLINITQLVGYKYVNFIIENYNLIGGIFDAKEIPYLKFLVPVGISYYTFQCIGYIINIYRKTEKPETHFGYFLIYNLFFPKILSGPIERSERFLPQLRNPLPPSPDLIKHSLILMMLGVFKKLVIAERLSVIVMGVYGNIDSYSGFALVEVFLIQAIYIYTDFSGYTDIALGMAGLFGIRLTDNFNRPFFSTNVTNFWRRWHISLSAWCNDYIFKTIIFKRRRWGTKASVYGVFITFLIIGFWHGPMWTFVILGLLQGIAINYEFFSKRTRLNIGSKMSLFWNNLISRALTYLFFSFSLIFFFGNSLNDSLYFVKHLFDFKGGVLIGNNLGLERRNVVIALIAIVILLVFETLEEKGFKMFERLEKMTQWTRWAFYLVLLFIILIYGQFATTNFIYFQF